MLVSRANEPIGSPPDSFYDAARWVVRRSEIVGYVGTMHTILVLGDDS